MGSGASERDVLAIFVGLMFGFIMLGLLALFIVWAAHEHHLANKYRDVLEAYNKMEQPTSQVGWSVGYKDKKGKPQTVFVPGNLDEGAMLKELVKLGVPYDRILSSKKVG